MVTGFPATGFPRLTWGALRELSADVCVGTKFRVGLREPGRIEGNAIALVEESLNRLQREQVDLIQMHNHGAAAGDGRAVSPEEAMAELGLTPPETPSPWNLFMNIPVGWDGGLSFEPPVSGPGDYVALRAEMN